MFDTLIPVSWQPDAASGGYTGDPRGPLPRELEEISRGALSGLTDRERGCPCCGGSAFLLRVGLADAAAGAVFLHTPVLYCTSNRRLVLTAAQAEEIGSRRRRLDRAGARRPPASEAPDARPFAPPLERLLAGAGELRYDGGAEAWLADRPGFGAEAAAADGVCFHTGAFPGRITLKLEPGTRCNFTCGFCYGRHLAQGNLPWDAFATVLDRIPGLRAVELTGEGEPLVNKQIFRMLAECARRGLWTHVTTNASLLTDRNAERLVASGVSSVAVSLESVDEERFAGLRTGGSLPRVLDGIRALDRARRRVDRPVALGLWVTLLRETLPELEALGELVDELGVDSLAVQILNPMPAYARFYDARLRANRLDPAVLGTLAAQAELHPMVRGALAAAWAEYAGRGCDVFMGQAMVSWQGAYTPCCLLKAPHFPAVGNVLESPFEEIWDEPRFRLFRFSLQHGVVLRSCEGCCRVASA